MALPLAVWAEVDGTFTNRLGMVQRVRAARRRRRATRCPAGRSCRTWPASWAPRWSSLEAKAVFARGQQKLPFMKDADWGRPMLPVQLRFANSRG